MHGSLRNVIDLLSGTLRDLAPILIVVAFFQLLVLRQPIENISEIFIGFVFVLLGLTLFIRGLEMALFPLGEALANAFARKRSLFWLLLFSFGLGFGTTVAEPALIAVSEEAADVMAAGGVIGPGEASAAFYADALRFTVALSVGCSLILGVLRILKGWPVQWLIISGYLVVVMLTTIAPSEIVGIAYDSGGVTTSTITVPLVTALGVGLASVIKGRNPMIDGFGLIAFASLMPIIFVLDVAPIAAILIGFQLGVLRRRIPNLRRVMTGSIYVILGLAFFLFGLERALFPLGKTMAEQLTNPAVLAAGGADVDWSAYYWTYLFAFAIGFSTTIAEPSLIAVAMKARTVSGGAVGAWGLRVAVALGVAASLAVGTIRIVTGTPLYMYMITGYVIVVIQTLFAPKMIVPLAYDSGGVTTSTVTVPLVAALGLGLASGVPGRSALLDGFGLIALASLFPMITVMGYAQLSGWLTARRRKQPKRILAQ